MTIGNTVKQTKIIVLMRHTVATDPDSKPSPVRRQRMSSASVLRRLG
jgi:hypothetical protein